MRLTSMFWAPLAVMSVIFRQSWPLKGWMRPPIRKSSWALRVEICSGVERGISSSVGCDEKRGLAIRQLREKKRVVSLRNI